MKMARPQSKSVRAALEDPFPRWLGYITTLHAFSRGSTWTYNTYPPVSYFLAQLLPFFFFLNALVKQKGTAIANVDPAIRVRPPLTPTDPGYELIPQRFQRSIVQVNSPTSLTIDSPQGKKLFVFDRVFSEDIGQEGIWDYLAESTTAFVQGYNVSLLAYGQSGAGKSYTMGTSGPQDQNDVEVMGMLTNSFLFSSSSRSGNCG